MLKYFLPLAALTLGACSDLPQPGPRAPIGLGQTASGRDVYRFQLTRTNALGVTPVSNSAIAARAGQVCPGGYTELGRTAEATRRISGVVYTDVRVTVACA